MLFDEAIGLLLLLVLRQTVPTFLSLIVPVDIFIVQESLWWRFYLGFVLCWERRSEVSCREHKVVVVKDLGGEIIQADWVFVWAAAALDVHKYFLLWVGAIVLGVHALLVGLPNCGLKLLLVFIVYDLELLWELAVHELKEAFERDKLEKILLLVQGFGAFGVVSFHGGDFGHAFDGVCLNPGAAVSEELVRGVPRILIIECLFCHHVSRQTLLRAVEGLSVSAKEYGLDAEHVAKELRLSCDLLLNCLLKLEHLLFHVFSLPIRHGLLPDFDDIRNGDGDTCEKLRRSIDMHA